MMETLGSRLKRLRQHSGMTQEQVAKQIYTSSQAIGFYENDSRQPTSDKIISLATLYHVSTDYLLGLKNAQTIDANGLTEREWSLVSELVSLMAEDNERLKDRRI